MTDCNYKNIGIPLLEEFLCGLYLLNKPRIERMSYTDIADMTHDRFVPTTTIQAILVSALDSSYITCDRAVGYSGEIFDVRLTDTGKDVAIEAFKCYEVPYTVFGTEKHRADDSTVQPSPDFYKGEEIVGLILSFTFDTSRDGGKLDIVAYIPLTTIGGRTLSYVDRREMLIEAFKHGHTFMYPTIDDPLIVSGIKTSLIGTFDITPLVQSDLTP